MIEALSPGLYELMIDGHDHAYEVSFEARSIDDILKFDDGREDETRFAAVAKLSEWSTKTYELTMRPMVRSVITPEIADTLVTMNPIRQRRYLFSDQNPLMVGIEEMAANIRHNRKPATDSNPFVLLERIQADLIEQAWNLSRDIRDAMWELSFNAIYSSPWMEVIAAQSPSRNASHDIQKFPEVRGALEKAGEGGYPEAIVRLLVLLAKARGSVRRDRLERSNRILHSRPPFDTMTPEMRAHIINEQSLIVQFAPEEALQALPRLLRDDVDRVRAVNLALDIAGPVTDMDAATVAMFERIQGVLLTVARDWYEPQPPRSKS
jgi:tellurite resistance protein